MCVCKRLCVCVCSAGHVWRVRERVCYAVAAPVSEGERRLLTTGEVYT